MSQVVGTVTTIAGEKGGTTSGHQDGIGTNARFAWPITAAVDPAGRIAVIVRPAYGEQSA